MKTNENKKLMMTVSFGIPQFNSFVEIDMKQKETRHDWESAEKLFLRILDSLPKRISKNWGSIQFKFDDETILVCKHWLDETGWDFDNSHEIIEIE